MAKIKILPEILSNQIAAGEVVERPSSVVKELVENSIDANATSITVEIEKGGKSVIRISDNGDGLSREDALLSIERYATSKIFTGDDLFSISTMGFRGEALPSIASVSKFTLTTKEKKSQIGTQIEISGGKVLNVMDAGAPAGTMVEVNRLFFNTPARRKFLKSEKTEAGHIADAVSGIALGNPDVGFRLFFNKKLQKNFPLSDGLYQRCVGVLGKDSANKLASLDFQDKGIKIQGFCTFPEITRSTSARIFLFVNNRLVYDRGLVSAIFQGYKGRIMKSRFPLAAVFVDLDYDKVDVNVHPSKRQVRFVDHQRVYRALTQAVASALSASQTRSVKFSKPAHDLPKPVPEYHPRFHEWTQNESLKVAEPALEWGAVTEKGGRPLQALGCVETQQAFKLNMEGPRILGQVMGTYIVAENKDGLMLVDQHAAHERIVYERLKKRYENLDISRQDLVVPETLDLNFKEAALLSDILADLASLGILVEPFGGNTFVIKSVPSIIDEKQIKPVVLEILDNIIENKMESSTEHWLDECLILMACHTAIRANKPMVFREMATLIADLEKCNDPLHCPHGRPTIFSMDKGQIEKLFKRVV
ncbi:MAG: DNA mismatch repair endonuclease MutL [Desulfobacteraceae bacterium]|nr:DNA mismatch repair endonuclease MutL [Desulfobacteraceae bacterium]